MEQQGYIHDMMDVKILILYALERALYPVDALQLYELCYQDDCLSWFDLREALPQLEASGHLRRREDGGYILTSKGRRACAVVGDSLAAPVARRVEQAVERFNQQARRQSQIHTEVRPRDGGDCSVVLRLDDEVGSILALELMAPTPAQANRLAAAFRSRAEEVYGQIMETLLREIEGKREK